MDGSNIKYLLSLEKRLTDNQYTNELQIQTQALLIDILKKRQEELKQEIYELKMHKENTINQVVRCVSDKNVAQKERDILFEEKEALKRERDELRNLVQEKDQLLLDAQDKRKKLRSSYGTISRAVATNGDPELKFAIQMMQDSLKN